MIENSTIIITEDFDGLKKRLKSSIEPEFLHIFESEEFKIENAKELIKEAVLTSKDKKYLVSFANKYNIYAQNALLKIVEEPPQNIVFIFVAKTKSTFLPTILSRLPVKKLSKSEKKEEIEIDSFDLEKLYKILKEAKKYDKSESKALVKALLKFCIRRDFRLKEEELEAFKRAFELIELNSNAASILVTLGLIVLKHIKKGR